MATKLDELFFEVSVRKGPGSDQAIATLVGSLQRTDKAAKKAAGGMKDYSGSTATAGKASAGLTRMLKRLVLAFGGLLILRKIVSAMTRFETRMAEISTIAGGGAKQVDELRVAIGAMTRDIPHSAEELGAGAYQILSAGISDTADILDVLEASSKAAVAGLASTEQAVNAITTVINAFGLEASEAGRVADVLFKTVELGKLKFTDLAANLGNAATSAALAGVSMEELTAGIAVLTQRGIFAAEATTSLNRLFLTLVQQTDEQRRAFKELGVEFSTTTVAERGFAGLMEELNKLTGGQIDSLAELFPNIRAARAAFVLAGEGVEDYRIALEKTIDSQGAAEIAFQKMNRTAVNQAKILRNNLTIAFQEIGTSVLPGLAKVFGVLSTVVRSVVGEIKVFGANMAVALQAVEVFAEGAAIKFSAFLAVILDKMAGFVEKIQGVLAIAATSPIPGLRTVAQLAEVAAGKLVAGLRSQEQLNLRNLNAATARLEIEKQRLEVMKQARDEVIQEIVAEDTLIRDREKIAEQDAAIAKQREILERLTAEQLERREKLELDLAKRIQSAVMSTAEAQLDSIAKLKQAYIEEYGEISEEVVAQFAIIEEAARKALSIEQARELATSYRDTLQAGLREIELQLIDVSDEERRTQMVERRVAFLQNAREEVERALQATDLTVHAEDELRKVLLEIVLLLRAANKEQKKLAGTAEKDADERMRDLLVTVALIKQATDGAIQLAQSFGLINDEIADMVNGLVNVGLGLETLKAGIEAASAATIISGGLGALGGVAQVAGVLFGESPEERKRREAMEKNTEAIKELSRKIGDFELDITGAAFVQLTSALQDVLGRTYDPFTPFSVLGKNAIRDLEALGISLTDVQDAARKVGITFAEEMKPTILELQALMEAMTQIELTEFVETFRGQLAALRAEFEIFNITDPTKQLIKFIQLVGSMDFGAPILSMMKQFDLATEEGRAAARKFVEDLFLMLQAGTITPAMLHGLTPTEFLDALLEIERLLDAIEEGAGAAADAETQAVRLGVSITEAQASALLAFQSTLVFLAEERNELLDALLATLGGGPFIPPPSNIPLPETAVGAVNIQVGPNEFTVTDAADAEEFVDEVSKQLGEKLRDADLLLGTKR